MHNLQMVNESGQIDVAINEAIVLLVMRGRVDFPERAPDFAAALDAAGSNIRLVVDARNLTGYSTEMRKTWVDVILARRKRFARVDAVGAKGIVRVAAIPLIMAGLSVTFADTLSALDLPPGFADGRR